MTKYFPWTILWKLPGLHTVLQFVQYSERFYSVLGFGMALVSGYALIHCSVFQKARPALLWVTCVILAVSAGYSFNQYFHCPRLLTPMLGDINSMEMEDYLPPNTESSYYMDTSVRFSDESKIVTESYRKAGTRVFYTYRCSSADEYVEFPLFYYPGC